VDCGRRVSPLLSPLLVRFDMVHLEVQMQNQSAACEVEDCDELFPRWRFHLAIERSSIRPTSDRGQRTLSDPGCRIPDLGGNWSVRQCGCPLEMDLSRCRDWYCNSVGRFALAFQETINLSHATCGTFDMGRLTLLRAWLDHDYDRCRNFCLCLESLMSREMSKSSSRYTRMLKAIGHLGTYLDFGDPCKHL
jgi:hypothetical protein